MEKLKNINILLILLVSSELLFYLLIIQTGILEYYNDDVFFLIFLPFGGVIGSILSGYIKLDLYKKAFLFLSLQLIGALFYPTLGVFSQIILGIGVGAMAPIVIRALHNGDKLDLALSVVIAYVFGTLLFNYPPENRFVLAILFTIIPFVSIHFINMKVFTHKNPYARVNEFGLIFIMFIWVFLDSSLFETLSRSTSMSLWRGESIYLLVLSHIVGVIFAIKTKIDEKKERIIIFVLFLLSYLTYFLELKIVLSLIYPATVSIYNVVILEYLRKHYSFKMIGIYMVFLGWMASGFGLLVSLYELIIFIPLILVMIGYYYLKNFKRI